MLGKIFIVSGSSGSGKTTIVNLVLEKLKPKIQIDRVITYTTREPRENEIQGIDYYFITQEEFTLKIKEGFFIEYSNDYGCYYGSPKYILDDLTKSWIFIVDYKGIKAIKEKIPKSVSIWIEVSSLEILEQRLKLRHDLPEQIQKRLMLAKNEYEIVKKDFKFDYVLQNNVLKDSILSLDQIIISSLND